MAWATALEECSLQMLPAALKLVLLPWLCPGSALLPWLSWTASLRTGPSEGSETKGSGQFLTLPSVAPW